MNYAVINIESIRLLPARGARIIKISVRAMQGNARVGEFSGLVVDCLRISPQKAKCQHDQK